MSILDRGLLLATGLVALYIIWRFWSRYKQSQALHDIYYMMGFAVLFVSGVLLIFLGYGVLASPFVLTVASLIPLGLSLGIANQFFPSWKKAFAWFALVGFLAIAVTSIAGLETAKKIAVPLFHGVAGLVIFIGPFIAPGAPRGFGWVGVGGALIGVGGVALSFLSVGKPLLGIFTQELVLTILAPLLLLMAMAFAFGFMKDMHEPA